jgi:CBS domain-containing protein/uncharacterized protein (DUF2267 family)
LRMSEHLVLEVAMSLESFRRPRLIVQKPSTSAHDAARAMESNHVGVVIVQDRGRIVGIVTDRDLALRVAGYGLDPTSATLREIMTPDVETLPIASEPTDALKLMRLRGVRRIPLLEGDRLVGLVTLDDLVLAGIAPAETASVIRAQLSEPSPLKPRGSVFPTVPVYGTALPSKHGRADADTSQERQRERHKARADECYTRLLHRVQAMAGLGSRELAGTALKLVLSGVVRRITPGEAVDLVSQLPSALHDELLDLPAGPDPRITRDSVERELAQRLDCSPEESARILVDVGAAIEQAVSTGELEDVKGQLPKSMRCIFPASYAHGS